MKVPEKGTIQDPKRWKKHRPVKWVARTQAYRDNYDRVNWAVKVDTNRGEGRLQEDI
jgi:hypothetical protein